MNRSDGGSAESHHRRRRPLQSNNRWRIIVLREFRGASPCKTADSLLFLGSTCNLVVSRSSGAPLANGMHVPRIRISKYYVFWTIEC